MFSSSHATIVRNYYWATNLFTIIFNKIIILSNLCSVTLIESPLFLPVDRIYIIFMKSFKSSLTILKPREKNVPWANKLLLSTDSSRKSFQEIPSYNGLIPSSLGLLISGGPSYLHEHIEKRHQELGPIFKEKLGSSELVFIADTEFIKIVLANEGPYPHHSVPPAWMLYNRVKNVERGLFFQTGEPWSRLRKVMNKVMLADPKSINRFTKDIFDINSDLLKTWARSFYATGSNEFKISDVKMGLCRWSIESTGYMLFSKRMNCIPTEESKNPDPRATLLVGNVASMFRETSRMQVIPAELAYRLNLGVWRRFEKASDNMIKIANEYVEENLNRSDRHSSKDSLMNRLLESSTLTNVEVSRSVVDLIIAAADTTSNSLQWMLYMIAKHQDVQEKIFDEIKPLMEDLNNLDNFQERTPYLRAFMREVSRLYPTAPFIARTLNKKLELGHYTIPAGKTIVFSLFTTSRMCKYFDNPSMFKPERWIRSERVYECPETRASAFASLPFGFGARSCVGRRAAELQMFLFIASFVKQFESSAPDDLNIKLNMILCPDKPIELKLKIRNRSID